MKMTKSVLMSVAAATLLSGCYGGFSLTQKVHKFNGEITGNKFINAAIFYIATPVYGGAIFVDAIVFNTLEFWTGSNPVAAGEVQEKMVVTDDAIVKVTASQNKYTAQKFTREGNAEIETLEFNEADKTWYLQKNGEIHKVATELAEGKFAFHSKNHEPMIVTQ